VIGVPMRAPGRVPGLAVRSRAQGNA